MLIRSVFYRTINSGNLFAIQLVYTGIFAKAGVSQKEDTKVLSKGILLKSTFRSFEMPLDHQHFFLHTHLRSGNNNNNKC
jgi:hypothetical protein